MDYSSFREKLKTICAINVVPFQEESKAIDWDGLEQNIQFLLQNNLKVIVPNGNTGEFYALTLDEAKQVTKKVVEIVSGRALVVAGIGYSVETAIELGKDAQAAGADCVMIHQPVHPYITEDGAVEYFQTIIEALDIPSIIYFKNQNLSDNVLKRLAPLQKLIGVKYAINDVQRVAKVIREVPKEHNITWICGTAEKWAPFYFHAGAVGFTSGMVNVHPQKSLAMLEALQQETKEEIWKLWEEVVPFENLRAKYHDGNNVVVIKEAMEQLGYNAGVTRQPVSSLKEDDRKAVSKVLQSWGLVNQKV
ncbi:dihydrodipicolinate synthase family protein [Gracilibacillus dipsosauri]|uniref:dihydrodipicolinate synthase family protein n=1 Tax=Gracilibacillus dipsosauri TaxID=178340 RepID=UPI0024098CD0